MFAGGHGRGGAWAGAGGGEIAVCFATDININPLIITSMQFTVFPTLRKVTLTA